MKILVTVAALAAFAAGGTAAETFTTTSNSTLVNAISAVGPDGKPALASFLSYEGQTTYADGRKAANKGSCASWPALPGQPFDAYGVCTYAEANGDTAQILIGCNWGKDQTQGDCWGGLKGLTGARSGKTGTVSWHFHLNPDGKTSSSVNAGQWND